VRSGRTIESDDPDGSYATIVENLPPATLARCKAGHGRNRLNCHRSACKSSRTNDGLPLWGRATSLKFPEGQYIPKSTLCQINHPLTNRWPTVSGRRILVALVTWRRTRNCACSHPVGVQRPRCLYRFLILVLVCGAIAASTIFFEGAALMHTPNRVTLASLSWWFAAAAAFLLVAAVVLGY
jgi:hypothetical protein